MIKLTDAQAALLRKLLGKLTERSTIAAALTSTLGALGIGSADLWAQVAGWLSIPAAVLLALINDKAFASLFKGFAPAPGAEVMEPEPASLPAATGQTTTAAIPTFTKDNDMSLLGSAVNVVTNVSPVLSAAYQGVTLIEALFPTAPGVQKLQAAQSFVTSKVGQAEDVVSTIEAVLAALKTAGVISSSSTTASVAPAAAIASS